MKNSIEDVKPSWKETIEKRLTELEELSFKYQHSSEKDMQLKKLIILNNFLLGEINDTNNGISYNQFRNKRMFQVTARFQ